MTRSNFVAALACAALLGCSGGSADTDRSGSIAIAAEALWLPAFTRITVEVSPAGVTGALVQSGGQWSATLVVPVGPQTLTLRAYQGETLVAQGSASVTVAQGQTASVTVLLVQEPPPAPDHGPLITAFAASATTVAPGEVVTLSAAGFDPDGDPLSYAWKQNCAPGVFADPSAASTTWSSPVAAGCTLTLTATSNGLSSSRQVTIVVQGDSATGSVQVGIELVPRTTIRSVVITEPSITFLREPSIYSPSTPVNATIPFFFTPGQVQNFSVYYANYYEALPGLALGLSDDCGGSSTRLTGGTEQMWFRWTAPSESAYCMLTFTVEAQGMSDAYALFAGVQGCPDDAYEPNDTAEQAEELAPPTMDPFGTVYPVPTFRYENLLAHDDDWYRIDFLGTCAAPTFEVTAPSTDDLTLQLWSTTFGPPWPAVDLLAEGTNFVRGACTAGSMVLLKVAPGASAATCSSAYALDVHPAP